MHRRRVKGPVFKPAARFFICRTAVERNRQIAFQNASDLALCLQPLFSCEADCIFSFFHLRTKLKVRAQARKMTAMTNDSAEQPLKIQKGRKSRALIILTCHRQAGAWSLPWPRRLGRHFWHPARCPPERSPVFTASFQLCAQSDASIDLTHVRGRMSAKPGKPRLAG